MQHDYAELHSVSNFSFLKAASHPEELVIQAENLGYRALALTDECSVAGVVRAYAAIKEHQLTLRLIVGSSLHLEEDIELVLLCPNRAAYAELCGVISLGRRRCEKGYYQLFQDDLIPLEAVFLLWKPHRNLTKNKAVSEWLTRYFLGRAWLLYERGLGPWESLHGKAYLAHCEALSVAMNLPMVCAGDVHMHVPQRQALKDVLTAIRLRTSVQALGHECAVNCEQSLRPITKIQRLFSTQMMAETIRIAMACTFELSSLRYEYPAELVPAHLSASKHLKNLVEHGAKKRFPQGILPAIQAIIDKELQLIKEQAYEYFFLTVHDLVQFAKAKRILYQGRGSAANSVVCYCLEITAVDPEQIDVLFERFISKERNEPPDIDVDFEHQRREEVFQYIYQKYGRDRAALAATVVRFKFRSAFRSVGKALGFPETQLEACIKDVDRRDKGKTWVEQVRAQGFMAESTMSHLLISLTEQIIGCPRHLSQHVGGFIISAGPLSQLVPVENASMAERTVIQWDKEDLESLGLLKVDVLALGMLSAIQRCFTLIARHYGRQLTIAQITAMGDDPKVYGDLQRGDSIGVFQVESRAQMSMLPRLKPACYYDLVIQIAIVRPGPIQGDMVHPYLRRREGKEDVEYPSEAVRAVLARTLGVPIFQEQVIKLAMVAAGFSGGEADQLRRAMASWKRSTRLYAFRDKLVNGMLERGYEQVFAERVFQQICGFGEYGFPESHSASFAVLAYVSAWLRHYYPAAFYASLLNSLPMGFYSASQLVQDAVRHGVHVLPVDVNQSNETHCLQRIENQWCLRLGLQQVKGLSKIGCARLLAKRPTGGYQAMREVLLSGLNKSDLAALASANACAQMSGDRYQARWAMLSDLHHLPLFAERTEKSVLKLPALNDYRALEEDYQSLGLSLAHHPMALLRREGCLHKDVRAQDLCKVAHKGLLSISGVVTGRQAPGTAGGVTFLTLEDETGNMNVIVWQSTARAQKTSYLHAKVLRVMGILEREGSVEHVIAGRLEDLTGAFSGVSVASRDFH